MRGNGIKIAILNLALTHPAAIKSTELSLQHYGSKYNRPLPNHGEIDN